MTYAKAFMRKVLTEGIDDADSFANTLADKRYQDFAETFNFARFGSDDHDLRAARARARSIATCARRWRRTPAQRTRAYGWPSISSARPESLTSPYSILADAALLKVAQTALGFRRRCPWTSTSRPR